MLTMTIVITHCGFCREHVNFLHTNHPYVISYLYCAIKLGIDNTIQDIEQFEAVTTPGCPLI